MPPYQRDRPKAYSPKKLLSLQAEMDNYWFMKTDALWSLYGEPFAAYGVAPQPSSASPTVALIEAGAYGKALYRDLTAYRKIMGLAPCPQRSCFNEIGVNGATPGPVLDEGEKPHESTYGYDWFREASMDAQAVSAFCPDCKILMVGASGPDGDSIQAAVDQAVAMGAEYVSMSYGTATPKGWNPLDNTFVNHPETTFVAATGDSGSHGAPYPANQTNVINAGGVGLHLDWSGKLREIHAWEDTGSGCASKTPAQPFQLAVPALATACKGKKPANDLSALADPYSGEGHLVNGFMQFAGGTSLAAPTVTALMAEAGAHGMEGVYAAYDVRKQYLRDITTGANGKCGTAVCQAGPGWDGPTGLGVPTLAYFNPSWQASTTLNTLVTHRVGDSTLRAATKGGARSYRKALGRVLSGKRHSLTLTVRKALGSDSLASLGASLRGPMAARTKVTVVERSDSFLVTVTKTKTNDYALAAVGKHNVLRMVAHLTTGGFTVPLSLTLSK